MAHNFKVGYYRPVRSDLTPGTARKLMEESEQILADTDRRLTEEIENLQEARSLASMEYYNVLVDDLMHRCISMADRIVKYCEYYGWEPSPKAKAYND